VLFDSPDNNIQVSTGMQASQASTVANNSMFFTFASANSFSNILPPLAQKPKKNGKSQNQV
jgi:hypothetical protein